MAKRPPNLKTRIMTARPAVKRQGWAETHRGSRHERGYGTAWDHLRAKVLRREPLCRMCRAEGRAVIAKAVDHITPRHLGGTDHEANLQPLCKAHHAAKTAKEGRSAQRR